MQPMQYSEASTNINLPGNRYSQTQPIKVNMQSTNTPSQNQISTLNERCQCEDDEMDHTRIQYISNFARQSALQYDQSQAKSHIPQAIDQGQVSAEYFWMICMT